MYIIRTHSLTFGSENNVPCVAWRIWGHRTLHTHTVRRCANRLMTICINYITLAECPGAHACRAGFVDFPSKRCTLHLASLLATFPRRIACMGFTGNVRVCVFVLPNNSNCRPKLWHPQEQYPWHTYTLHPHTQTPIVEVCSRVYYRWKNLNAVNFSKQTSQRAQSFLYRT